MMDIQFLFELERLILKYYPSIAQNTPPEILATYMAECLCAFEKADHRKRMIYMRELAKSPEPIDKRGAGDN